ncbi:MAG TPA: type VI secretion system contractile sheath large subunit [Pyrinomonadaceae bacterium]|nr:type VI secretion system contractile sheath large subunit [Pyrinomonadaceae bacterium]
MFPNDNDFESKVTLETEATPIAEEPPFHILLLGDWSGRENKGEAVQSDNIRFSPIEIDRDNFDEVMEKLGVELNLKFGEDGENALTLRFTKLEDFHPDSIFQQISLFADLRDIRRRLLNPNSFPEAAREVRLWFEAEENFDEETVENSTVAESEEGKMVSDNLLDLILDKTGETPVRAPSVNVETTELNLLLKKIVKPFLVQTDEGEQDKLLAAVDQATSDLMRKILHHPQFRLLEAAWRGLYFLVRRVETDSELKIFILDISKDELTDNLKSFENLTDSPSYRLLNEEVWAVVCGNYAFSVNVDDIAALIRLGKIASSVNTPFISHLKPEILGIKSLAETPDPHNWIISDHSPERKLWATFRGLPESSYIGLAIPRLLARLPYGAETEPTESFSFEEFNGATAHNDYLWFNPCFACALLLAQSFSRAGWKMAQSLKQDIDNLPLHIYQENGETKTKPGAEVVLTQTACEIILEQGLMPLLSFRNSDVVRLARLQSVASPPAYLRGRWNS